MILNLLKKVEIEDNDIATYGLLKKIISIYEKDERFYIGDIQLYKLLIDDCKDILDMYYDKFYKNSFIRIEEIVQDNVTETYLEILRISKNNPEEAFCLLVEYIKILGGKRDEI